MRAFEVSVNGKKLCVAGIKDDESLSTIVSWAPEGPFIDVSGSIGVGDFARWIKVMPVALGDEIRIRVIDAEAVDEPISTNKL